MRHPLHKLRDPFGKDLSLAPRIATEAFPHGKAELDLAPAAGHIAQTSAVGAMNGRREFSTERTTRRWVRGDHRDEQTVFGELDLLNQHPFSKRQKWSPFHHTLASQAKLHSRGFSWKGVEHVLSLYGKKKQVSGFTKSGHEPSYSTNIKYGSMLFFTNSAIPPSTG